jgi:hypothetical protein
MFRLPSATGALIACAVALPSAFAAGTPTDPDPTHPAHGVRPLVHRSTLAARAASAPAEAERADWRAANERVRAVGGWRTYLRQATAPEPEVRP